MAHSRLANVDISELLLKQEAENTVKSKKIYWKLFIQFLNENDFKKR